ncbi:hypothetical protein N0443_29530 [Pseudomonas aeruginosa]|nr:hypothetical protein [Pseudomonas aeruginosa]MCS8976298.1 hypothetical protein [Pseudomonas aeruginosa]MCS8976364.1 hypothetical protein [Pseudomonas aeruginosa]
MTESKICTCPSGDGSLVHPCQAHPAEQAEAERPEVVAYRTIGRHTKHQHPHYALNYYKQNAEDQAAHWRERGCEVSEDELMTVAQHERIVGALRAENAKLSEALDRWPLIRDSLKLRLADALARVAGLEAELETERVRLSACATAALGYFDGCADAYKSASLSDVLRLRGDCDAALSRVAELEMLLRKLSTNGLMQFSTVDEEMAVQAALGGAPVAQAQQLHNLDKQCRDDVARALGLRPNQERGFAWSYLLASIKSCVKASGDSAQAQHSVPIAHEFKRALGLVVAALEADGDRPTSKYALSELKKVLAAAPGTEVPQAWLDVQAERRRQITAEGWTPDHDDLYCAAELPRAAAAYILSGANDEAPAIWPFSAKWWKPRDARANYMRAGALILAEIERLDRAAERGKEVGHE